MGFKDRVNSILPQESPVQEEEVKNPSFIDRAKSYVKRTGILPFVAGAKKWLEFGDKPVGNIEQLKKITDTVNPISEVTAMAKILAKPDRIRNYEKHVVDKLKTIEDVTFGGLSRAIQGTLSEVVGDEQADEILKKYSKVGEVARRGLELRGEKGLAGISPIPDPRDLSVDKLKYVLEPLADIYRSVTTGKPVSEEKAPHEIADDEKLLGFLANRVYQFGTDPMFLAHVGISGLKGAKKGAEEISKEISKDLVEDVTPKKRKSAIPKIPADPTRRNIGKLSGRLNDVEGMITRDQKKRISEMIEKVEGDRSRNEFLKTLDKPREPIPGDPMPRAPLSERLKDLTDKIERGEATSTPAEMLEDLTYELEVDYLTEPPKGKPPKEQIDKAIDVIENRIRETAPPVEKPKPIGKPTPKEKPPTKTPEDYRKATELQKQQAHREAVRNEVKAKVPEYKEMTRGQLDKEHKKLIDEHEDYISGLSKRRRPGTDVEVFNNEVNETKRILIKKMLKDGNYKKHGKKPSKPVEKPPKTPEDYRKARDEAHRKTERGKYEDLVAQRGAYYTEMNKLEEGSPEWNDLEKHADALDKEAFSILMLNKGKDIIVEDSPYEKRWKKEYEKALSEKLASERKFASGGKDVIEVISKEEAASLGLNKKGGVVESKKLPLKDDLRFQELLDEYAKASKAEEQGGKPRWPGQKKTDPALVDPTEFRNIMQEELRREQTRNPLPESYLERHQEVALEKQKLKDQKMRELQGARDRAKAKLTKTERDLSEHYNQNLEVGGAWPGGGTPEYLKVHDQLSKNNVIAHRNFGKNQKALLDYVGKEKTGKRRGAKYSEKRRGKKSLSEREARMEAMQERLRQMSTKERVDWLKQLKEEEPVHAWEQNQNYEIMRIIENEINEGKLESPDPANPRLPRDRIITAGPEHKGGVIRKVTPPEELIKETKMERAIAQEAMKPGGKPYEPVIKFLNRKQAVEQGIGHIFNKGGVVEERLPDPKKVADNLAKGETRPEFQDVKEAKKGFKQSYIDLKKAIERRSLNDWAKSARRMPFALRPLLELFKRGMKDLDARTEHVLGKIDTHLSEVAAHTRRKEGYSAQLMNKFLQDVFEGKPITSKEGDILSAVYDYHARNGTVDIGEAVATLKNTKDFKHYHHLEKPLRKIHKFMQEQNVVLKDKVEGYRGKEGMMAHNIIRGGKEVLLVDTSLGRKIGMAFEKSLRDILPGDKKLATDSNTAIERVSRIGLYFERTGKRIGEKMFTQKENWANKAINEKGHVEAELQHYKTDVDTNYGGNWEKYYADNQLIGEFLQRDISALDKKIKASKKPDVIKELEKEKASLKKVRSDTNEAMLDFLSKGEYTKAVKNRLPIKALKKAIAELHSAQNPRPLDELFRDTKEYADMMEAVEQLIADGEKIDIEAFPLKDRRFLKRVNEAMKRGKPAETVPKAEDVIARWAESKKEISKTLRDEFSMDRLKDKLKELEGGDGGYKVKLVETELDAVFRVEDSRKSHEFERLIQSYHYANEFKDYSGKYLLYDTAPDMHTFVRNYIDATSAQLMDNKMLNSYQNFLMESGPEFRDVTDLMRQNTKYVTGEPMAPLEQLKLSQKMNGWYAWGKILSNPSSQIVQAMQSLQIIPMYSNPIDGVNAWLKSIKGMKDPSAQKVYDLMGADAGSFVLTPDYNNMTKGMRADDFISSNPTLQKITKFPQKMFSDLDTFSRKATINDWLNRFRDTEHFKDVMEASEMVAKDPYHELTAKQIEAISALDEYINTVNVDYSKSGMPVIFQNPMMNTVFGLFKKYDLQMMMNDITRGTDMILGEKKGRQSLKYLHRNQIASTLTTQMLTAGFRGTRAMQLIKAGAMGLGVLLLPAKWAGVMDEETHTNILRAYDRIEEWHAGQVQKADPATGLAYEAIYEGLFNAFTRVDISSRLQPRLGAGTPATDLLLQSLSLHDKIMGTPARDTGGIKQSIVRNIIPTPLANYMSGLVMSSQVYGSLRDDPEEWAAASPWDKMDYFVSNAMLSILGERGLGWAPVRKNVPLDDINKFQIYMKGLIGFTDVRSRKTSVLGRREIEERTRGNLEEDKVRLRLTDWYARSGLPKEERDRELARRTSELYEKKGIRVSPRTVLGAYVSRTDPTGRFLKGLRATPRHKRQEKIDKAITNGTIKRLVQVEMGKNTIEGFNRGRMLMELAPSPVEAMGGDVSSVERFLGRYTQAKLDR